jgi:DME family drug/metabolite transporter
LNPAVKSRLQIVAAAALFSTGGAAVKATSLSSWQVAGLRSGIAAVAMFFLLRGARGRWSFRTLLVGLTYAATLISFVTANKLTTSANAIFLQSTAPLYIVLLAPWLLRERVTRRDLLFMAAIGAGLAMFFVGETTAMASAPNPSAGNAVAALSGVFWALTMMGLRWLGREEADGTATLTAAFAGNVLAFLFCLPWALPLGTVGAMDWLTVGYLGVFQIGLAYLFLTEAVRHLPALETALILLLEPALNPIWAWLVHGERPGVWALAGGGIILAATAFKALWDAPRSARQS